MKLITAMIKPFKLAAVREALAGAGVNGMTVTEVKGIGRQKGHTGIYRGAEYWAILCPRFELRQPSRTTSRTRHGGHGRKSARTGEIGDGRIFVMPIDHAVRIRTARAMAMPSNGPSTNTAATLR